MRTIMDIYQDMGMDLWPTQVRPWVPKIFKRSKHGVLYELQKFKKRPPTFFSQNHTIGALDDFFVTRNLETCILEFHVLNWLDNRSDHSPLVLCLSAWDLWRTDEPIYNLTQKFFVVNWDVFPDLREKSFKRMNFYPILMHL